MSPTLEAFVVFVVALEVLEDSPGSRTGHWSYQLQITLKKFDDFSLSASNSHTAMPSYVNTGFPFVKGDEASDKQDKSQDLTR